MVWGVTALLVGLAYGYMATGREDKMHLLWKGTVIGAAVGIAFAVVGAFSGYEALGLGAGPGLFLTVVVLTVMFVIGVWIGDLVEAHVEAQPPRPSR